MSIVKTSLSFLPMEDIAGDLIINKGFTTKESVNDSITKATTPLAMASGTDRNTVKNAEKLGGKPPAEYLTAADGTRITGIADNMSTLFSGEVKNIRDELYQLKAQLSKNGYIEETSSYEGFQDSFKNNNIKYESLICGIEQESIALTDTLYLNNNSKVKDFEAGKHFIIYKTNTKEEQLVTVSSCNSSGKVIFYPSSALLYDKTTVELHKSAGAYLRNSFSFSKVDSGVNIGSNEKFYMQANDTSTTFQTINKSNTGYAIAFKVPDYCISNGKAALINFSITARTTGTPGNLLCHALSYDSVYTSGAFSPKFVSIEDAKNKGFVIASSQPLRYENAMTEKQLAFDFFNLETNKYPEISNIKYVFLVECVNADTSNYWDIKFSYYSNATNGAEDLEKYNSSFKYNKVIPTGSNADEKAIKIIDNIDKYDMIFLLTTKEVIEQQEVGNSYGLYTAKIVLPNPIDVSRARLTTRINREGCYYVESYNSSYTKFVLAKEDAYAYSATDLRFDENDTVIIGNQIGKIKKSTSNTIELVDPIYIDSRIEKLYTKNNTSTKIPVYRMNYEVSIKPYLVNWKTFDTVKKEFTSTAVTPDIVDLDLIAVLPTGNNEIGSRVSDRLLFECDFGNDSNGVAKLANEFEFQIKWKSKFTSQEINNFSQDHFKELVGRVNDLVLTFDKNY